MKKLLFIPLCLALVSCASSDSNVTLEKATINAQPVTGGKYKVTVKGYSSTKVPPAKDARQ